MIEGEISSRPTTSRRLGYCALIWIEIEWAKERMGCPATVFPSIVRAPAQPFLVFSTFAPPPAWIPPLEGNTHSIQSKGKKKSKFKFGFRNKNSKKKRVGQ
ncbi:hypothetical protein VPH35_106835 [Triticum aestivum]